MSSLVAYASSDDSESDDGEVPEGKSVSTRGQSKEEHPEKDIDLTITQPGPRNVTSDPTTRRNSSFFLPKGNNINNNNNGDVNVVVGDNNSNDTNSDQPSIFQALPTPSSRHIVSEVLPEEELEDLVKPKKTQMVTLPKPLPLPNKRVQISIPALDSDSDEEEMVTKKKPKFSGTCNLLDILPPPKHMSIKQLNRTLIPYTLSKKPPPPSSPMNKKAKSTKIPKANVSSSAKILTDYNNSDEDEDQNNSSDFFSLDLYKKPTPQLAYSAPSVDEVMSSSAICSIPLPSCPSITTSTEILQAGTMAGSKQQSTEIATYPQYGTQHVEETCYEASSFESHQPSTSDENFSNIDNLLQDEQFLRLQGKNRRGKEQIQFVDVNTDDFIDPSELTKTLTQEMPKHSHKKDKDGPSKQSRSKHQITYLAYQAKERELELKNQWSQNKLTKRQTQAKYGF